MTESPSFTSTFATMPGRTNDRVTSSARPGYRFGGFPTAERLWKVRARGSGVPRERGRAADTESKN